MSSVLRAEMSEELLSVEGIPQALTHDLLHLMAQQKMVGETQHILARCQADDAIVVVGSDLKLRLDILAIDEQLENVMPPYGPNDPSKSFDLLLERFDFLRKSLASATESIITDKWPSMRAALVRQAALSRIRSQKRDHAGPEPFDWDSVSTDTYIAAVDRLLPHVGEDMDALDSEEQMIAAKERRNLTDVFTGKHSIVSGLKIRTLLRENRLKTFENDMKAFTRGLDSALLPKPKLLQMYTGGGLLDDSDVVVDESRSRSATCQGSPNSSLYGTPMRSSSKRKGAAATPSAQDTPKNAKALAEASEHLQREMEGHPGTVAEALDICAKVPESGSPIRKRAAPSKSGSPAAGGRSTGPTKKRSHRSIVSRSSPGEQVDFDDSQSVDEPADTRPTLHDRSTPPKGTKLASPASEEPNTKKARARTPWTEEEVMHLNAAVKALGKGKWSKALSSYKFQDCRTAVDLKDKWRNLQKI